MSFFPVCLMSHTNQKFIFKDSRKTYYLDKENNPHQPHQSLETPSSSHCDDKIDLISYRFYHRFPQFHKNFVILLSLEER